MPTQNHDVFRIPGDGNGSKDSVNYEDEKENKTGGRLNHAMNNKKGSSPQRRGPEEEKNNQKPNTLK